MDKENIHQICFLVERNSRVGFGHFARCRKIANHLDESGYFNSSFVLFGEPDNETENMHANLELAFNFIRQYKHLYDVVIVDSYLVTDDILESIRKFSIIVGYIEDSKELSRVKTDFFIKLCSDFQRTDLTYGIPVIGFNNLAKLLQTYPRIKKSKHKPLKHSKSTKNFFVCLGGVDTSGEACNVFESILKQIDGAIIQYWTLFEDKRIKNFAKENPSVTVIQGKKNIVNGLKWADIAIVSGGNLAHEALGAGIPTIILSLIDNQQEITRFYSKNFQVPAIIVSDSSWSQIDWLEKCDQAFRANKQARLFNFGEGSLALDLLKQLNQRWHSNCLNVSNFEQIDIGLEYQKHSQNHQNYKANRWGSNDSAAQRYEILVSTIEKNNAYSWLDVGCGTGECQKILTERRNVTTGIGIEQSPALLERAKEKRMGNFKFFSSFSELGEPKFDLISCVGVLSKSNLTLTEVMRLSSFYCIDHAVLIIDLPNRDWFEFEQARLAPDPRHLWYKTDWILKFSCEQKNFKLISFLPFGSMRAWLPLSEIKKNVNLTKLSHCNYWMFRYEPD